MKRILSTREQQALAFFEHEPNWLRQYKSAAKRDAKVMAQSYLTLREHGRKTGFRAIAFLGF